MITLVDYTYGHHRHFDMSNHHQNGSSSNGRGLRHCILSPRYVFFFFFFHSPDGYLGIDYAYGHQQHLNMSNHHRNNPSHHHHLDASNNDNHNPLGTSNDDNDPHSPPLIHSDTHTITNQPLSHPQVPKHAYKQSCTHFFFYFYSLPLEMCV
jgi:hypothetical protein